jgi:very-short-patch-repair endonuclease
MWKRYNLEKMQLMYGNDIGKSKFEEYKNKQATSNTFEYKNKKYGMSKEEFNQYNKSRAATLENMIDKYGETEGIYRWNKYVEKQKYAGSAKEYFIEKYGKIAGTKKYEEINKSKAQTSENFIKRYGRENGKKLFLEYLNKRPTSSLYSFSKKANMFFDLLDKEISHLNLKTYHGNKSKEYYLWSFDNNIYFYDFCIPELDIIIEFNGSYWHADPTIYNSEDEILFPNNKKVIARHIWDKDVVKNNTAIENGFHLFLVWEKYYDNNSDRIIKKLKERIENKWKLKNQNLK